jgi:hypothetical protein
MFSVNVLRYVVTAAVCPGVVVPVTVVVPSIKVTSVLVDIVVNIKL